MTELYKDYRIIDGKPIKVILDETGKIVSMNPSKEELEGLEEKPYIKIRKKQYTIDALLDYMKRFNKENGRSPTAEDFKNHPEYPNCVTYQRVFGSWSNALKGAGLDTDSMVRKGIVKTNNQKARLAELKVLHHFKNKPIDLAGENCKSPCDGICPNGKTYDVKGSRSYKGDHYSFRTKNKHKDEIEIYYLLGYNEDYTILEHAWRVPGEMVDSYYFYIAKIGNKGGIENIESMKEYEITDKIIEVINQNI